MERRSDSFWLAVLLGAIHLALLVFLAVVAWRTTAMVLFRKDNPPPPPALVSPSNL